MLICCALQMASDRYLAFGIIKGLQAHAESGAPTYMYHFSFSDGNQNLADTIGYRSWEWGKNSKLCFCTRNLHNYNFMV